MVCLASGKCAKCPKCPTVPRAKARARTRRARSSGRTLKWLSRRMTRPRCRRLKRRSRRSRPPCPPAQAPTARSHARRSRAVPAKASRSRDRAACRTGGLRRSDVELCRRLVRLVQYRPDQRAMAVMNFEGPLQVVYLIASSAQMDLALRQERLELDSVRDKLERVNAFLTRELEVLELGKKIQHEAQEEMGKAQREDFLREQLKAIQRELGEESEKAGATNHLRTKIEQAHMPEQAFKEAMRALARLEKIPRASPAFPLIRTYLHTLVSLP